MGIGGVVGSVAVRFGRCGQSVGVAWQGWRSDSRTRDFIRIHVILSDFEAMMVNY